MCFAVSSAVPQPCRLTCLLVSPTAPRKKFSSCVFGGVVEYLGRPLVPNGPDEDTRIGFPSAFDHLRQLQQRYWAALDENALIDSDVVDDRRV